MKIQVIISCFIALSVTINAQVFSKMSKQRVTLNKPHRHSSPEERRKNSLFPKMARKFVVTMNPNDQPYIPHATVKITTETPKKAHSAVTQKMLKSVPTKPAIVQPRRFAYTPKAEVEEELDEVQEEVNESQQDIDEGQEIDELNTEYVTDKSGEALENIYDDQDEPFDDEAEDQPDKREISAKIVQKRSWSYVSLPITNRNDSSSEESDEKQFIFIKHNNLLNKAKEDEEITTEDVTYRSFQKD